MENDTQREPWQIIADIRHIVSSMEVISRLGISQTVTKKYALSELWTLEEKAYKNIIELLDIVGREPVRMLRPVSDDDDHITINTWLEWVAEGYVIDSDGIGALATDIEISNVDIWPSMVQLGEFEKIRGDFTHVVWFNK